MPMQQMRCQWGNFPWSRWRLSRILRGTSKLLAFMLSQKVIMVIIIIIIIVVVMMMMMMIMLII